MKGSLWFGAMVAYQAFGFFVSESGLLDMMVDTWSDCSFISWCSSSHSLSLFYLVCFGLELVSSIFLHI